MVTDTIENAGQYAGLGKRMATALKYLKETDFSSMEPGKYIVDGDEVFVLVQEYESNMPEALRWEGHRRYTDIQYVFQGKELMGYAKSDSLKVAEEYNEKTDCVFFKGSGIFLDVEAGTFAIFAPQDAHMPRVAKGDPSRVKKVVVKVKV